MFRSCAFIICTLLSWLCVSCGWRETDMPATYTVSLADFEDVLTVTGVVEPLRSTTLVCPPRVDGVIVRIVDDGIHVETGDTVCVIDDRNLTSRRDQLVIDLENAEANLEKVRADLALQYALLEVQVQNSEAAAQIAGLDSLQIHYMAPNRRRVRQLELEKQAIEKTRYERKLDALGQIQQSELRRLELEIARMRQRLADAEEAIARLVITAPMPGLATRLVSWATGEKLAVGDNVWNHMPLVSLPEMTAMKVKIMASERDFKAMNVGDTVTYAFDAMPGATAYGRVTKKMPVGQPVKRDSKVKVFEVEASVDSAAIMPDPGFTATCRVSLHREAGVTVVPQVAVFEEDSARVVYVQRGRGYERREVSTGTSSLREVVITEGLTPGDVVCLTKPKKAKM